MRQVNFFRSFRVFRWAAAAALIISLVLPPSAKAFFQTTKLEGTLGTDISGIWIGVYHVMPTFRVRLDTVAGGVAPFSVKPLSADARRIFGDAAGVQIDKMSDPSTSSKFGLFPGDIIVKLNVHPVKDVDSFNQALKTVTADWFLITVRRPQLMVPKVRLVKFYYSVTGSEDATSSEISREIVRVNLIDGDLPFQGALDKARSSHSFFEPSEEQLRQLREQWYRLPEPKRAVFVRGEHRVVSAENYDGGLRKDDNMNGTSFAIVSTLDGNPMVGGGKTIGIHGVRKIGDGVIEGSYVESSMGNAPFPISIEFDGSFVLKKIAPYSDKDFEHTAAQAQGKDQAQDENLELAPDVPESDED